MKYLATGNEALSLPCIREEDGAVENCTFLYMAYKGMIQIKGSKDCPWLYPFVEADGRRLSCTDIIWERTQFWIPSFTASFGGYGVRGTILAPVGERGFAYRLTVTGNGNVKAGLAGCWDETIHSINEDKPIEAAKHAYGSGWNHSVVFDLRQGVSVFSFAPIFDDTVAYTYKMYPEDGRVGYSFYKEMTLSGESQTADFYFGIGYEEVGAATAAKEMARKGFEALFSDTERWLAARKKTTGDEVLDTLMNTNMFFNFFFASGRTLDTEEFALVTSRSPRYYVSAAYWDRDSLLWSFPSILMADPEHARNMLLYVFTRQIKNAGIHSRYIDGIVLEPGFELDELCAPVIALSNYVKKTGDCSLLGRTEIIDGVRHILKVLMTKKNRDVDLFETFLQPTDDMHVYIYLTYDNALVCKILRDIAELFGDLFDAGSLKALADRVKAAVYEHCVKEQDGHKIFAWSVDLQGHYDIYDEPPGSLQLLPLYGFCPPDDSVYKATVGLIHSEKYPHFFGGHRIAEIGCPHAPYPWILSICNSILCGDKQAAYRNLMYCKMDNGIACESVNADTGECETGAAFATCAGFLAYAIYEGFGKK